MMRPMTRKTKAQTMTQM